MKDGLHGYIRTGCVGCGQCAKNCCTEALSLAGKLMDAEAVLAAVMRDEGVYHFLCFSCFILVDCFTILCRDNSLGSYNKAVALSTQKKISKKKEEILKSLSR